MYRESRSVWMRWCTKLKFAIPTTMILKLIAAMAIIVATSSTTSFKLANASFLTKNHPWKHASDLLLPGMSDNGRRSSHLCMSSTTFTKGGNARTTSTAPAHPLLLPTTTVAPMRRRVATKLYGMKGASALRNVMSSSSPLVQLTGMMYLCLAAGFGILSDVLLQKVFHNNSNGLVTLLAATVLSNSGHVPSTHPMYDAAWNTVLPASLAFLVIGTTTADSNATANDTIILWKKLYLVGVAFAIACIGSLLGCIASFLMCYNYSSCTILTSSSSTLLMPGIRHLILPPELAALAAGCLCASYIGGSVNFFATARILLSTTNTYGDAAAAANSMLSSMAGADVVLMALYFAILSAVKENRRVISWFEGNSNETITSTHEEEQNTNTTTTTYKITTENNSTVSKDNSSATSTTSIMDEAGTSNEILGRSWSLSWYKTLLSSMTTTCFLLLVGAALVRISNAIESYTGLPGASTISITALASAVSLIGKKLSNKGIITHQQQQFLRGRSRLSSLVCFHIFYASLGYSANVVHTAPMYYGPASLVFGTIALLLHILVTFAGCSLWNKISATTSNKLTLQDIMIASNAAVGGSATAASFAGTFRSIHDVIRRALVISGTLWGVVGYAIGTSIGVGLSRMLMLFFQMSLVK